MVTALPPSAPTDRWPRLRLTDDRPTGAPTATLFADLALEWFVGRNLFTIGGARGEGVLGEVVGTVRGASRFLVG